MSSGSATSPLQQFFSQGAASDSEDAIRLLEDGGFLDDDAMVALPEDASSILRACSNDLPSEKNASTQARGPRVKVVNVPQSGYYVVIDVPGDGSCLIHAFHLGLYARYVAGELSQEFEDLRSLLPEDVAKRALQDFRGQVPRNDSDTGEDDDSAGFARMAAETRKKLREWLLLAEGNEDSLRQDVQTILLKMLENTGLVRRVEEDEIAADSQPELSAFCPAPSLADDSHSFWFAYYALYHPERRRSLKQDSRNRQNLQKMAGLLHREVQRLAVPMGVSPNGELARLLRAYVLTIGDPDERGFLPIQSVVIPDYRNIPDELIDAYIDELGENQELWCGPTALEALAAAVDVTVKVHTFDHNDVHIESHTVFESGRPLEPGVTLYQSGGQNHFQVMIGPFSEIGRDEDTFAADEQSAFEEKLNPSPTIAPDNQLVNECPYRRALAKRSNLGIFTDIVGDCFDQWYESPGPAIQIIYRHAALKNCPKVFSLSGQQIMDLLLAQSESEKGKATGGSVRTPIIPLGGFIAALIDEFEIDLDTIAELLALSCKYVQFHKEHPTWDSNAGRIRTGLLKSISDILNALAHYDPRLARGPSIADFNTTPCSRNEPVGTLMRALLTINPGELEGYEPVETGNWRKLKEVINGYVRAHLLNKHLGGPGDAQNIGFLSSEDNTRMSRLCEEFVKRKVLEDNCILFLGVEMPLGKSGLEEVVDLQISNLLASHVRMHVAEITPISGEDPDLEFVPIRLMNLLGLGEKGLHEDRAGVLSFETCLPDKKTISKVTGNQTNLIGKHLAKATSLSLTSMFLPPAARKLIEQAQHVLINSNAEPTQVLDKLTDALKAQGLAPEQIAKQIRELRTKEKSAAAVKNASQNSSVLGMKGEISAFISAHPGLDQARRNKLANCSQAGWKRVKELLEVGCEVTQAINVGTERGDMTFDEVIQRLKKRKRSET